MKLMLIMALPLQISAQSLSTTVVSSAGGYFTSASASLSYTVAEMTMVQTFSNANNFLTQGFQQPEDIAVTVPEAELLSSNVILYPNPTCGYFSLDYFAEENCTKTVNLYDLLGQLIISKSYDQIAGLNTVEFDISSMSQGLYLIELQMKDRKGNEKSEFYKVNLLY